MDRGDWPHRHRSTGSCPRCAIGSGRRRGHRDPRRASPFPLGAPAPPCARASAGASDRPAAASGRPATRSSTFPSAIRRRAEQGAARQGRRPRPEPRRTVRPSSLPVFGRPRRRVEAVGLAFLSWMPQTASSCRRSLMTTLIRLVGDIDGNGLTFSLRLGFFSSKVK